MTVESQNGYRRDRPVPQLSELTAISEQTPSKQEEWAALFGLPSSTVAGAWHPCRWPAACAEKFGFEQGVGARLSAPEVGARNSTVNRLHSRARGICGSHHNLGVSTCHKRHDSGVRRPLPLVSILTVPKRRLRQLTRRLAGGSAPCCASRAIGRNGKNYEI